MTVPPDQLRLALEQKTPKGHQSYTYGQLTENVTAEDDYMAPKIRQAMELGVSKEQALNYYAYASSHGKAPEKPKGNFFQRIWEDVQQRSVNVGAALERHKKGEQGVGSTALQTAGEAFGLAFNDVPGEVIESAIDITPDALKQPFTEAGKAFLNTPVGQAGLQALVQGMETYEAWKAENVVAAENLESLVNIGMALPVSKIAGAAGKTAATVGETAIEGAMKVAKVPREAIEAARPNLLKLNAKWANVPDDVLERAVQFPDEMETALGMVRKNPDNPFLELAQQTGGKLKRLDDEATASFKEARDAWKAANPEATFDVSQSVGEMYAILNKEFNVSLRPDMTKTGKILVTVKPGPANKFTTKEVSALQELIQTLANAKNFKVDDLLDLNAAFDKAYDAVRLTELKQAKPYHAMVMRLKSRFDELMRGGGDVPGILPDEMKVAYDQVSRSKSLLRQWGGQLLEGEGGTRRVSQQAESFVKSLSHQNKGARRDYIKGLEDALGVNLTETVDFLQDAKILSKIEPPTGGRQGDIIKAYLIPTITTGLGAATGFGVGGFAGSFVGAEAGRAAGQVVNTKMSSPAKLADRAIDYGKKLKKNAPKKP